MLKSYGRRSTGEAKGEGREGDCSPVGGAPFPPVTMASASFSVSSLEKKKHHLSLKGEGLFFCLVSVGALLVGVARYEVVVTLLGIGGLAGFLYGMVSLLWVLWGMPKECALLQSKIFPEETDETHPPHVVLSLKDEKNPWRLRGFPGINSRYHLVLATRDGRTIEIYWYLPKKKESTIGLPFPSYPRGAYEIKKEEMLLYDFLGFWELTFPQKNTSISPVLLVRPLVREGSLFSYFVAGGIRRRENKPVQKTEDLTDHRPYVPGDDPRRINWKLYGHSRELFVRKEEIEPPPQSEYVILLDTYCDPSVYSNEHMWFITDKLVLAALGLGRELLEQGGTLLVGCSGASLQMVQKSDLSYYFAFPYGQRSEEELPLPPPEKGVFLFALPRQPFKNTALTTFLMRCQSPIQLIFVCGSPAEEALARDCQRYYAPYQRMIHVSFLTF
ncbi:MAG: DUF58 domain-containing protein [Treponemataceae bacterium]|nr:DUF58 domain-containing protein [Treponemataceae bacterium]